MALTSGCSLSMPLTIRGTAKNLKNAGLAGGLIPATTNIQQIGDCITNAFLCFILYKHFHGIAPDMALWLSFTIVFVAITLFSEHVLVRSIFIMLSIMELAIYARKMWPFFWPLMSLLIHCSLSNVMANGALCRVFEKVLETMGVSTSHS